jgi:UDP-glucose 4-epimerase
MKKLDRVLVTGASGLVGSHVMASLARRGVAASGLSRRGPDLHVDLLDTAALAAVPWASFSHVIHAAAAIPSRTAQLAVNVEGTHNLLEQLPRDLSSLVFVSSISVAGSSDYAVSKQQAEARCLDWARAHDVPLAILRPTSIYGLGMAETTILSVFLSRARAGLPLTITAPRDYLQNFIWAQDVAEILVDAALGLHHGAWELSSDDTLDALALANLFTSMFGGAVDDQRAPPGGLISSFDNRQVKRDLRARFTPIHSALRMFLGH